MKKVLIMVVLMISFVAAFSSLTSFAEGIPVTVAAVEGWGNASFDPDTNILTNISEGYAFGILFAGNEAYLRQNGVQTAKKIIIPASFTYNSTTYPITRIATSILGDNNTAVEEVIFTDGITDFGPTGGGNPYVFTFLNATGLKRVTLPSTLTALRGQNFKNTGVIDVTIPASVTMTGNNIFQQCTSLKSVIFEGNLTAIGDSVFGGSTVETVTFNGELVKMGSTVFGSSYLSTLIFKGHTAPAISSFGASLKSTDLKIYYPADGVGYDLPAFRDKINASGKTVNFIPMTVCKIQGFTPSAQGYDVDYKIALADGASGTVHYAAIYNGDNLVAVKSVAANETQVSFTTGQTATSARIFVWGGNDKITPLCASPTQVLPGT